MSYIRLCRAGLRILGGPVRTFLWGPPTITEVEGVKIDDVEAQGGAVWKGAYPSPND